MSKFKFWGAVAKDGGHIRAVEKAESKEDAECLLMQGWTPALKELYEVKRVDVTVAEEATDATQSGQL